MTDHNLGKWVHNFEGQGQIFEIDGRTVAMFKIDGKLYAFDDMCPHIDGSLGKGKLDGKLVACPLHDWQFDVTNGECVTEEELDNGWFVETYPVKFVDDDIILSLPS
jgi:nitrite reductase/ring-hydroxylating ferredoxin subunit